MSNSTTLRNVLFCATLLIATGQVLRAADAPPSGDRGGDPQYTFPDNFLRQNGGPIIDVTRPPQPGMHAAKGDGVTDDTDALKDAYDLLKKDFATQGDWKHDNYYIYLPNGTYLVKDTIIYRGDDLGTAHKWTGKFDINHIAFIGQSRAHTTIRLADHCDGFQNAASPKPVLAYQHLDTVFNNIAAGNFIRNLTIDTGSGNAGAIGLFFQGANQTDMHHVTVQSGDGEGVCGISFPIGSAQGYYADNTVKGFDIGINDAVKGEGDLNFEYLTLTGQKVAGIAHSRDGMSLRRVLSDQQNPDVPAIVIDNNGSQTIVLDSDFRNRNSSKSAIEMTGGKGQQLLVRNVTTTGYTAGISVASKTVAEPGTIAEYISSPVKTFSTTQPAHTLNLPVEDTPPVPQFAPADWSVVDDASQLQAAMDSGKPEIVFRCQKCELTEEIRVPATVKVINEMGARVKGKGLVVAEPSTDPLFLIDSSTHVRVDAQRNLVQHCAGGGVSNPKGLPITFFLENVNDNTTGNNFCRVGQKVFARSIDIEYRNTEQIVCNGGLLWIFGYKTEYGKSSPFVCRNGGSMEILGGYTNATSMPPLENLKPIILNDNSNVSASLFVNLRPWSKMVEERMGGQTSTAASEDFPRRGKDFGKMCVVPLYVGTTTSK